MNYNKVLSHINGEGIQQYDQGEEAIHERIDIRNGVCRALVVMWLTAKSNKQNFWSDKGTIKEGLLQESNRLKYAVNLQKEYEDTTESRFIPDTATANELRRSGLTFDIKDVTASAQEGFAQTEPNDEPIKIANKVLFAQSRFYILSIKGSSGAHSIGIYRPTALIGKSKQIYLFDPNVGEFKVTGEKNLKGLLSALNSQAYESIGINLNKSYILWSYNKN